jgi:hypothetical protein
MRKRGFICILLLSMLLTSCGSSNSDQASNQSLGKMDEKAVSTGYGEASTTSSDEKAPLADKAAAPEEKGVITEKDLQTAAGTSTTSTSIAPVEKLSGFNSASTAEGLNKKLIYTANLVMQVKKYAEAQSEVRNLVSLSGGYIVEFSESQSTHEVGGTFVLKVPANGFSSLLEGIEQIKHESYQQSIKGQDVSEEYVDLESRLKVKGLMETQYIEFMKKATKTTELVSFANELGKIQEEIELIKGRMRYINNNVAYSTVEIRLYQQDGIVDPALVDEEKTPLFERANEALKGTIDVLTLLFQWIVVILFGAMPIILVGGVIWLVLWMARRKLRQQKINHPRSESYPSDREETTIVSTDEQVDNDLKR